jgi:uncharacterized protein YcbX
MGSATGAPLGARTDDALAGGGARNDNDTTSLRVVALSVTPVKATRLRSAGEILLSSGGARGNREFFLIDDRDRMINAKRHGSLQTVVADWDEHTRRLRLSFPDRTPADEVVEQGAPVEAHFYSETAAGSIVEGPWQAALSSYLGAPVRLVKISRRRDRASAVDRGLEGAVTLISSQSLAHLAARAGAGSVDARRFRMLVEVDGVPAHGEDDWIGRRVLIGGAEVRLCGNVGRCLVTSLNPDSGERDLPTLDLLRDYRAGIATTEPLPFGVHGAVVREGAVRVGDEVTVL